MDIDEFNRKTRKLCLSRANLFKNTSLDQFYNRYLDLRSLLPPGPSCCPDVCPGCYRHLTHSVRIYRIKAVKQKFNKTFTRQIKEVFTCRFCRVGTTSLRDTRPNDFSVLAEPKSKVSPASLVDILNFSNTSASSNRKSRRRRRKDMAKEAYAHQSAASKSEMARRSSLNDFLDLM